MIIYSSRRLLKRSPLKTYVKWGANFLLYVVFIIIYTKVYQEYKFESYFTLILNAVVVSLIICISFLILNSIIDKNSFSWCKDFISKRLSYKS